MVHVDCRVSMRVCRSAVVGVFNNAANVRRVLLRRHSSYLVPTLPTDYRDYTYASRVDPSVLITHLHMLRLLPPCSSIENVS